MRKSKLLAILLCALLLFYVVAACNNDNGATSPSASSNEGNAAPSASGNTSPDASSNAAPSASGAASPSASGSASAAPPAGSTSGKDTLSIVVSTDLGTLAHQDIGGDMFAAVQLINEPLWYQAKMAGDDGIEFKLAESLEVVSPTEWIIHLRQGVKFSNGNPFTASDVIFSAKTVQASLVNGVPRGQLQNMEKSQVIDDYTVLYIWDDYHIGQYGIMTDVLIVDEESYGEADRGLNPIGTGPYVMTEYVTNSHLFLERRDDYWGEQPEFKYVNFRVLSEPSQIANALETGLVDLAPRIDNNDVDHISSLPNINVLSYYDTSFARLNFNCSPKSPMHDVEARYAICHAIDRQAIADIVYGGRAEVLKRPVCITCADNEDRFDNMSEIYSIGYNVDMARGYAESSGLVGKTIRLMNNGAPEFVMISEMVQNMLEDIGISVQIVSYDAATFTQLGGNDVDAEAWDISVNLGINPGYLVANNIVMGIRSSRMLDTPGMWGEPGEIESFVPTSYTFYQMVDPKERADFTYWALSIWTKYALSYGLVDTQVSTAISTDLDPSTFVTRHNGGVYILYLKSAK